ncbi:alpha/beta hydrolase [Alteromonas sp. 07-89-2]|uniref:alpha/beta hydrolase family protein n=1 Tax=Alteromonas TaxID=226 RepID=UPI000286DDB4|nr:MULTISPECIES: alpha/beta hydrolase [Alteromonas]AFT95122.1 putative lipase/esterase [Alteromonas macleodii str. 'Balearic Sea AD45']MDK2764818.1 alpha/beta hydrolase [Alteromonas macleodii]NOH58919.1 alpha/beta hydrolase [Alteromonas sp. 07-89-2]PTT94979.1 alpha/beta hydrolase [Pseudomonas sp. HMWF031]
MKTVTYVINSIALAVALSTLTLVAKVQADSSFSVNSTYADTHDNNGTHYEESRPLSSNEDTHDDLTLSVLHEAQSTVDGSDDAVSDDTHTNEEKKTSDDTHANSAHANNESSAIYPKKISQVPYSALGVLPTSEADEQFSYGDDPLQTIYTWHGRSSTNGMYADKALIFIHGGCWLNAYGYEHAKGMYHALAELGMGVYVTEYRRVGDKGGGWPGSLDDVTQAISTALKRIENEGRYTNIYIAGHSAGGHLALLAAQRLSSSSLNLSRANIKRIIGLAAITDIQSYAMGHNSCQSATAKFMNGMPEDVPTSYQRATPRPTHGSLPITLLQGDADSIVPARHAVLSGTNQKIIKNGGHFDWLHPESTSFDALLEVISEHDE